MDTTDLDDMLSLCDSIEDHQSIRMSRLTAIDLLKAARELAEVRAKLGPLVDAVREAIIRQDDDDSAKNDRAVQYAKADLAEAVVELFPPTEGA